MIFSDSEDKYPWLDQDTTLEDFVKTIPFVGSWLADKLELTPIKLIKIGITNYFLNFNNGYKCYQQTEHFDTTLLIC